MATLIDSPGPVVPPPSFQLVSRERCLGLLSSTTVGRIAFSRDEDLVLLPVNYRLVEDRVVVRVSTSGALGQLVDHDNEVVFEVDYHSATGHTGWSVLVRGRMSLLARERDLPADELARVVPWASGAGPYAVLTLPTDRMTGRVV
ncbi:MAG: putative DNA-binding protein [Marmoricola sp.]|nr:putative DNA-binding protein [Marmoricola sp.]